MTTPGHAPELDLSVLGTVEQAISIQFLKLWFLTFARSQTFKNRRFPFLFARPSEFLANRFYLDREILILFSPYVQFDARALDFVDRLMSEYMNRLDKLCLILISKDPNIRKKVREMSMQDKELRLIVPFTYDDFENSSSHPDATIIARLKEFLYERDLFAVESPLRHDTSFFGRTKIVQYLYSKYKAGENSGLFGLRKIGKTSALYAIQRYLGTRNEPALYMDCSEPGFHQRRWNTALHMVITELAQSLNLSHKLNLHPEEAYTEINASIRFSEDLKRIFVAKNKQRLLLIFDEVENITFDLSLSSHWSQGKDFTLFWQAIRAVFQKNPNLFSFILAGVNPKAVETATISHKDPSTVSNQSYDNPIYKFVTPIYLELFRVEEVKEMVSSIGNYMGLQFEEQVYTYLTDDFGGHPFLIRQACIAMHKSIAEPRPFTITRYYYSFERTHLNKTVQGYIQAILEILKSKYQDEYVLLEYLAQGDHKAFLSFVEPSRTIVEHLEGYGIITEDNNRYHFRIKAIEDYLLEQSRIKKPLETIEDKWREVSKQRNRLETDLRTVVKRVLKTHLGAEQAKQALLEIIGDAKQKTKLSSLPFDRVFESDLYFLDLKKVILKHWDKRFDLVFNRDRETFVMFTDLVNRHRIDAHANPIDDATLTKVLTALEWLQKYVDAYLT